MTPFQQMQIWFRRASGAQRIITVTAAVLAVGLVAWLVTPVEKESATQALTAGNSTGLNAGPTATTGLSLGDASTATTVPGRVGGVTATTLASGAVAPGQPVTKCPTGIDQGATADSVTVAATIVNLAGAAGNDALNLPSPEDQEKDYQLVSDAINASGGVGCRKLVMRYYTVNPIDAAAAQQACLRLAADKPFMAVDPGALTAVSASDCIPAQKIPLASQFTTADQIKKYYPYYINALSLQEEGYRNAFLGAVQKGYFSAASGFKKLGVLAMSCRKTVVAAGRAAIQEAGIPDSQVVVYDAGCPTSDEAASAFQPAVQAFKNAGVTHVTVLDFKAWEGFTKTAQEQNFKPKYILGEDVQANTTYGSSAPDPNNLDGAYVLMGRRLGEQDTPGYKPSAGTSKCDAIYAKAGMKPTYKQGAGYGGAVCNLLWFVAALLDHAPTMQRSALVNGIRGIGTIDYSFPWGPVDYSTMPAGGANGRESWRVVQFFASCACFEVVDSTFHPRFP